MSAFYICKAGEEIVHQLHQCHILRSEADLQPAQIPVLSEQFYGVTYSRLVFIRQRAFYKHSSIARRSLQAENLIVKKAADIFHYITHPYLRRLHRQLFGKYPVYQCRAAGVHSVRKRVYRPYYLIGQYKTVYAFTHF